MRKCLGMSAMDSRCFCLCGPLMGSWVVVENFRISGFSCIRRLGSSGGWLEVL